MPNIKGVKKRVLTSNKRKVSNNDFRTSMRTAIKKVEKETDKTKALENLNIAFMKMDKACSKGLVHSNYVARQKSRLTKKVNTLA